MASLVCFAASLERHGSLGARIAYAFESKGHSFFQENALGSKGSSLESERGPAVFIIVVGGGPFLCLLSRVEGRCCLITDW